MSLLEIEMGFEILDCTLRDGGYYTDWDFDESLVETYLSAVSKVPISAIEFGYCNHPSGGYKGEFAYLGKKRLRATKAALRPDQQLGIMLDAKAVVPDRISELLGDLVGVVDLVRMAIAPKDFPHGLEIARELKKLGFKVGFNTMYLSKYSSELSELEALVGHEDLIDIIALVDSYGGCKPAEVGKHIANAISKFPNTPVGFHGHDNTCLGFANAIAAVDAGAKMIDSTFVGMGRGAGNTRTEMLLVEKSRTENNIDFEATSQIVAKLEEMQAVYKWGTNLPYMLSGSANLPQKDVMDWLGKNRYSPISVVRALQNQSSGVFDEDNYPDLLPNMLKTTAPRTVLIIGGGKSVSRHLEAIRAFAEEATACVIHANTRHLDLIGQLGTEELICLPGHAAHSLPASCDSENILGFVAPVAPRFPGTIPANLDRPVFQTRSFMPKDGDHIGPISDIGPLALGIGAAKALSANRIFLVGFDGYANAGIAEQELAAEIQATIDRVRADPSVSITSLTPTLYDISISSVYGEVQAERVRRHAG